MMNAAQYQPGGAEWEKVQAIMNACDCSRLRAVSALKSCENDTAAAIENLTELLTLFKPLHTVSEHTSSGQLAPERDGAENTVPSSVTTGAIESTSAPDLIENHQVLSQTSHPFVQLRESSVPAEHVPFRGGYHLFELEGGRVADPNHHELESDRVIPVVLEHSQILTPPPAYSVGSEKLETRSPPLSLREWDFILPSVPFDISEPEFTVEEGLNQGFSLRRLLCALQSTVHCRKVPAYLAYFKETTLSENLNRTWEGFPAIFYAVSTNDEFIVRTFVNYGAHVNVVDEIYQIPLLALTILMGTRQHLGDTTAVTTVLLSVGADASVIPSVFYSPYIDDPPSKGPFTGERYREFDDPNKQWCSEWMRPIFARAVNLSQRYFLEKTLRDKRASDRQWQVAATYRATALLGLSYMMIGQVPATRAVTQKLISYLALPRARPLVMIFAGPSGHGKTELAKRMGELLSLDLECIDCTEMRWETDLFGPKKPYIGHELGSPLNNFLSRLSGRRGIVFLDEFEKTTKEVQNALLIPFDEGKYTDRRDRTVVDCSKIIWILTTNAMDDTILDYCDLNQDQIHQTENIGQYTERMTHLSTHLKQLLKSIYGNPLAGRVSLVVPFLPFSANEAAVVAHKYMLELQRKALQAVELSPGRQMVGHIQLDIMEDGSICKLIADEGYDADQGARSLKVAVESRIVDDLVQKYLEEDGKIVEKQPLVRYVISLSRRGTLIIHKDNKPS